MKTMRILNQWLPMLVLTIAISFPLAAQEKSADAVKQESRESSAAGSWKWTRPGILDDVQCEIHLSELDGKLTGEYNDSDQIVATVSQVAVEGDAITVKLLLDNDGKESVVTLQGTLSGDRITGTITSGKQDTKWAARRFVALEQLAGKWKLEFTTPDGETREPEFELSVDDNEPVVNFLKSGSEDATKPEITDVHFKNGFLYIEMQLEFQGQDLKLDYELEMKLDDLEGMMFFQIGEESAGMNGELEVTGTRIK